MNSWTLDRFYLCMVIVSCQSQCFVEQQGSPFLMSSNPIPDCKVPALTPTTDLNKLTEA